jgi:hypothetical protein
MADYYLNHTASEIDAILTKVDGIEAGANVNVQADWNQTTTTADDYIKNKPTLGTASALNAPASGDAATTEVVKGDDSRLTDARHADDVYSWAKAATKPAYTASEVGAVDESNVITTTEIDLMFA